MKIPDGPRKHVKFLVKVGPYGVGQTIDLVAEAADRLVDKEIAVYAKPPGQFKLVDDRSKPKQRKESTT